MVFEKLNMNLFRKSRSRTPSFEIPKLCFSKEKRSTSVDERKRKTLDVPPLEQRERSSSFDSTSLNDTETIQFLSVPKHHNGPRCHSYDTSLPWTGSSEENMSDKESSNSSLKVPKYQRRRSSLEIPKLCIHCVHNEAMHEEAQNYQNKFYLEDEADIFSSSTSYSDSSELTTSDDSLWSYSDDEGNESDCEEEDDQIECKNGELRLYRDVVTLTVPVVKQQRSSSMDACFVRVPENNGDHVIRQCSMDVPYLEVPKTGRSSSVDVSLPTDEDSHYKAYTSPTGSP